MRYLKNLVAQQTFAGILPWEWTTRPPEHVREDKAARTLWATSPKTDHHLYNGFEGLNEQLRVTKPNRDEEGNPPFLQHALVADFDAPWSKEGLEKGCERVDHAPNYLETTLSNNARLLWVFEAPLKMAGYEFAAAWCAFLAEKLRIKLLLPGLDEPALITPNRYYTNSGEWLLLNQARLPASLLTGWLVEFSRKHQFKGSEYGSEVPLEQVSELLQAKYPRFSEWSGDFLVNSQGPSFWIEGSTSPMSAVVKPGGMITFAAHAGKLFYPWEELVGAAALDQTQANKIGKAVENVFFDGNYYFRKLPSGVWKPFSKSDILGHLKTTCRLSAKFDKKTGSNELESAIQYIHDHQYVNGAAPFAFRKDGLVRVNGADYLNNSTRRALIPADGPVTWGPNGQFPWISGWLDNFFDPAEQKDFFLAWLAYFYRNAHARTPRAGQNVFIAGGRNVGKTLLNRKVVGALVGGYAEAVEYLMGNDSFGSELFDSGLWVVDDDASGSSNATQKKFTACLKKMAANNTFRYHAKFREPMQVEWSGRVVVTCNSDEESIRILPNLDMTILDKLMLFRAKENTGAVKFPGKDLLEMTLDRELPYFARWLVDYEIPLHLMSEDPRFGVVAHHDPHLVASANHSSSLAAFREILMDWKETYFKSSKDDRWEGSSFQLHRILHSDPSSAPALRNVTVDGVGRSLSALKNRGDGSISCREDNGLRLWSISRPDTVSAEIELPAPVGKTRFEK